MTFAIGDPRLSIRGRVALFAVLGTATLASWGYLVFLVRDMSAMPAMPGGMATTMFNASYLCGLFVMWLVMQAAMMLPSAVPMIHAFARMRATGASRRFLVTSTALFAGGYLAAWSAFSLGAALFQAVLTRTDILEPMGMKVMSGPLAGALLIVAGLYQWIPLKHACLRRCRTPMGFLMTEWRYGRWGPFIMGSRHGLFCVGCCWALMCLLFVLGVMNTIWIAIIAVYVLLEKVAPWGEALTRLFGTALILWGGVLALS